jgi:hypothetical protein
MTTEPTTSATPDLRPLSLRLAEARQHLVARLDPVAVALLDDLLTLARRAGCHDANNALQVEVAELLLAKRRDEARLAEAWAHVAGEANCCPGCAGDSRD